MCALTVRIYIEYKMKQNSPFWSKKRKKIITSTLAHWREFKWADLSLYHEITLRNIERERNREEI